MEPDQKQRILTRAVKAQREGRAGDAIKLRILANEAKTIRYGRHP